MTDCAKCGADIGEADICPNCGEPSVNQAAQAAQAATQPPSEPTPSQQPPTQPAPVAQQSASTEQLAYTMQQPTPAGQPVNGVCYYAGQPANAQAGHGTAYRQPPGKISPLVIIAGVFLIVLGAYYALEATRRLFWFLSYISELTSNGTYSSIAGYIAEYPWPKMLFGLFVDIAMIATGIMALILAEKVNRTKLVLIAAITTGALMITRLLINVFSFLDVISRFGSDYLSINTTIFLDFIPVTYPVVQLFNAFLCALALAAIIILIVCSLRKRNA